VKLSSREFKLLSDFIYDICGLSISESKMYLVQQRLEPLVIQAKCSSFEEYYQKNVGMQNPRIREDIANAMTTNETSFFRDQHPFNTFGEYVLPRLATIARDRKQLQTGRKGSKIRIWSAAASTGEEPYSISMLIHEFVATNPSLGLSPQDFSILATDISTNVLSKAISGEYTDLAVRRGLSSERLQKYFINTNGKWYLEDKIRQMVEFRCLNLTEPFTLLGGFDLIFCRNVMIYFDNETKSRIFSQFHQMLSDNGLLILGTAEHIYQLTDKFKTIHEGQTIIYEK